jgi:flagellar biogenesis protein FliO
MDQVADIPFCPIPPETISDLVPMLVVLGFFVLAGWLVRSRRKRRRARRNG